MAQTTDISMKKDEQYSEQEAERRFLGSLKAALNLLPKLKESTQTIKA